MAQTKERAHNFIISEKAWNIMQQYARIAYDEDKNEVSGITCVKKVTHPTSNKEVWELFDPIILKQENTGTTTELDGDALRDYYVKAAMKYGEVRFCWWHSHHTMGAFWSNTDENEIKQWKNDSWSLALVINLYEEYKLNVSTWDPIEHSEDVSLEILRSIPKPTKAQLKEYEELCSDKVSTVMTTNYHPNYRNFSNKQTYMWNKGFSAYMGSNTEDALTKDGKLNWNNQDSLEEYGELYSLVVEEIDEILMDFAAGEADYDKYSEFIKAMNTNLKKRNARMTVKKFKKGSLLEKTATLMPYEHLKFENEQIKDVYLMAECSIDIDTPVGGNHYVH